MWNSVTNPPGVIRPIACVGVPLSRNQRLPSGPVRSVLGAAPALKLPVPERYSVIVPAGVIFPIACGGLRLAVNQTLPSGPSVMSNGLAVLVNPDLNSVIAPPGVIRPTAIELPPSVNHRLPSAPAVMPSGSVLDPSGNSVIAVAYAPGAAAAIAPIAHAIDKAAARQIRQITQHHPRSESFSDRSVETQLATRKPLARRSGRKLCARLS